MKSRCCCFPLCVLLFSKPTGALLPGDLAPAVPSACGPFLHHVPNRFSVRLCSKIHSLTPDPWPPDLLWHCVQSSVLSLWSCWSPPLLSRSPTTAGYWAQRPSPSPVVSDRPAAWTQSGQHAACSYFWAPRSVFLLLRGARPKMGGGLLHPHSLTQPLLLSIFLRMTPKLIPPAPTRPQTSRFPHPPSLPGAFEAEQWAFHSQQAGRPPQAALPPACQLLHEHPLAHPHPLTWDDRSEVGRGPHRVNLFRWSGLRVTVLTRFKAEEPLKTVFPEI